MSELKQAMYRRTVTVCGSTTFPVDMLRYDRCVPATETDAAIIERTIVHADVTAMIVLNMYSVKPRMWPTDGRWLTFGWRIVSVED